MLVFIENYNNINLLKVRKNNLQEYYRNYLGDEEMMVILQDKERKEYVNWLLR